VAWSTGQLRGLVSDFELYVVGPREVGSSPTLDGVEKFAAGRCDRALRKSDHRLSVTATTACTLAFKHCTQSRSTIQRQTFPHIL
jgi:hypothetical protein